MSDMDCASTQPAIQQKTYLKEELFCLVNRAIVDDISINDLLETIGSVDNASVQYIRKTFESEFLKVVKVDIKNIIKQHVINNNLTFIKYARTGIKFKSNYFLTQRKKLVRNGIELMDDRYASWEAEFARLYNILESRFINLEAEEALINVVNEWFIGGEMTLSVFKTWMTWFNTCMEKHRTINLASLQEIQWPKSSLNDAVKPKFLLAVNSITTGDFLEKQRLQTFLQLQLEKPKIEREMVKFIDKDGNTSTFDTFTLNAIGRTIFLSLIKDDLESFISRSNNCDKNIPIKQVDILAANVSIDCDLKGDVWQGINIVIVADKINVCGKHIFDVSGKGYANIGKVQCAKKGEAGRYPGHGKKGHDGRDGKAGESSGNIYMATMAMTNPDQLTLKLCGGDGENGENGGVGGRGADGKGVTKTELDNACVKYGSLYFSLWKNFSRYQPNGWTLEMHTHDYREYVHDVYTDNFGRRLYYDYGAVKGVYNWYDLIFLIEGSNGTPGGIGGLNGIGGEGGNRGDCIVINPENNIEYPVKKEQRDGIDGKDGGVGAFGEPGTNGNDMAIMNRSGGDNKMYIGHDKKVKLKITYHSENSKLRRINRYRKLVEKKDDCYVEFKMEEIVQNKIQQTEQQKKTIRSSEAKMTMKQPIVQEEIIQKAQKYKSMMKNALNTEFAITQTRTAQPYEVKKETTLELETVIVREAYKKHPDQQYLRIQKCKISADEYAQSLRNQKYKSPLVISQHVIDFFNIEFDATTLSQFKLSLNMCFQFKRAVRSPFMKVLIAAVQAEKGGPNFEELGILASDVIGMRAKKKTITDFRAKVANFPTRYHTVPEVEKMDKVYEMNDLFKKNRDRIDELPWDYSKPKDKKTFASFFSPTFASPVYEWMDCYMKITNSNLLFKMLHERFEVDGNHLDIYDFQFIVSSAMLLQSEFGMTAEFILNYASSIPQSQMVDEFILLRFETQWKTQFQNVAEVTRTLSLIKNNSLKMLIVAKLGSRKITEKQLLNIFILILYTSAQTNKIENMTVDELISASEDRELFELKTKTLGVITYYINQLRQSNKATEAERLLLLLSDVVYCFPEKVLARVVTLIISDEIKFDDAYILKLKTLFEACTIASGMRETEKHCLIIDQKKQCDVLAKVDEAIYNAVFPEERRDLTMISKLIKGVCETDPTSKKRRQNESLKMVATIKDGSHEAMILLNEFDECIFKLRGCRLRDTQKIAIIYAVMSDSNLLAQVNTGEGKSYIVSAIAIIRIKTKAYKFVDVITASSLLAQRDVDEMRDIYSAMQVSVGHNCDEQMENRMTMYKAEVVYGEIGLFQKDYLLHHFYRKNIFGERGRSSSCAIVDEVDNMLLDNGNNMLYLSHNIAGLELLEPLFIHIQRLIYEVDRMESAPSTETIETMILTDLMGRLTKDDIADLAVSKQTKSNTTSVWSSLVNANVIDSNGYFLIDNDLEFERRKTEIAEVLYTSTKKGHAERILVCLKAVVNRIREIEVPRYLVPFCRQHLTEYIDNAKRARSMKHKEAYVVDNDTKRDQPLQVTIVDHNTGVDMSTSQWCDGLHQAVQIKHGCRVNPVSMKAVFVSNVNYLKGYARINGLSGTLGSEEESKTLVELYDAHLIKIPPSKAKKFYERVPVITQSYDEWINALFTAIKDQTNAKRSLLVICQSISAVDDIERGLLKRYESLSTDEKRSMDCLENRIVYRREHETFAFDNGEELDSGRLILATNLAGRGTNIKLSEELKLAGGLHVILSFLPANARIEEQAYGRAARCGECGSGQIIALTDQTIASGKPLTIFDMKSFRDTTETQRLKALTDHYNYQTKIEEDCLMEFKEHYLAAFTSMSNDKKRKNDVATENEIIYFAFLDEWALWLDSQASIIKQCAQNLSDSKRLEIINSVKKFLELHPIEPEQALKWIKRPQPLLALGISKIDEQSFDDAKRIFTKIIDDFPEFGGDASYYLGIIAQKKVRKFRRVSTTDYEPLQNVQHVLHETVKRAVDYLPDSKCEMDDDKRIETEDCLIRAIHGFRCRIERKQESYRTVSVLQQLLGPNDPKSEGFKLQTEDVANVYNSLCTSAYDMMGHPISPSTFSGNENMIDMNLQAQKTFSKCRHEGYVTEKAVNHNIANEQCEILRKKYTLSRPKVLRTFKAMIDENRDNTTETYKRTYLNERVIRQQLYLPNREDFWEYLARNSCFTKLQKYYILNTDGVEGDIAELMNLKPVSPPEPTELRIQLSDYDLRTCTLFDAGEVEKVFKKDKHRFAWLIEMEYLVQDASALINRERFDNIVFMEKLDDFNFEMAEWLEVPVKDATWIVNKLLQTQSLQKKLVNTTTFIYQTADFDFSTIPKCLKSSVNTFLIHKFAYTFAYNALRHSLDAAKKDPTTKNRILLPSKPHENLMKDLTYYGLVHDHKIELREKDILDKEMQKRLEEIEKTHKPRLFIKSGQLKSTKTYFKDVNVDASHDIQDQAINHIRQVGKIEDNYAGIFWNILKIGKTLLKAYLSISCPVTFLLFVYDNYDECMECLHLALSIGAAVGTLLYYQQLAKAKSVLHQRGRSEEQQFSRLLDFYSRNVQTGQQNLKQSKLADIIASSITSKITKPFNDPSHFRNYSSFKTLESKLSSLLMSSGMTPKHFKSMAHKFLEHPSRWQFLHDAVQDILIPTVPALCKHYYKIVQSCKSSCEFDLNKALSDCKTIDDDRRIQLTEADESFICSLLCKIVEDIIVLLEETTRNVASQEVQAAESYLTELQEDAGSDNSDSGSETENNDGQILKTNKQCLKAVNGFMIALFSRTKNIYQQEIKNNVCERLIPVFTKYANKPDEIPENDVVKNGLTMRNKVRQNDRLKYGSIQFETYQPKSFIINDFQEIVQQMYAKQPSDKLLAVMIQYGYAMKSNMVHALSSSLFLVLKRYMHNLQDVVPKVALEKECIIFHVIRYQCTSSLKLKLNNDSFYICKKDLQKIKTNEDISCCLFESFVKQFPELSEMGREGPSVFRENLLKHL